MKTVKITLLQYLYYYNIMTVTDEEIQQLPNDTVKIATNGFIEGKHCSLIDFERLELDECYLIV